jgi:hypothetical protein
MIKNLTRFNISLLLLILSNIVITAQEVEILDKNKVLKNHIRTRSLYEYDYVNGKPENKGVKAQVDSFDLLGQKVQQVNYRDDGSIMAISTFKYDSKGNKTEVLKYASDDKDKSKIILNYSISIKYDSKGNKTMETGFNGVEDFKNIYNYNREGKLAEINFFLRKRLDEKRVVVNTDDKATNMKILDGYGSQKYMLRYKYNNAGKVIEETRIENDNTISQRILYGYDNNNNLINETKYINEKLIQKLTYTYNSNGQISEISRETPKEGKYVINRYIYDDNGLLKEFYWREDNNSEFSKNSYTYDSNGLCKTIDSYYGKYKQQVLSVNIYTFY